MPVRNMKSFFIKKDIADGPMQGQCCMVCAHFRNSPEFLEKVIPGLKTMSSGHASVRKDDGICMLHDLYLSASAYCEQFVPDGVADKIA
jgi:hypothetical protein